MGMVIFILGLAVGSFLNVCIYRLPREESVVRPGSRCPACRRPLAWHDNIPLFSFLWLQGRCRRCKAPISFRYPAVELLSAVLFWALWQRWGIRAGWFGAAYLAVAALVVVAAIDWDTFMIPDILSLGLLAMGLLTSPINPYFSGSLPWRVGTSLSGAAVGFFLCWGIAALGEAIFKKEAMGGGDVKLMAGIGAWTGWLGAFDTLLIGSLLGSIFGISQMLRKRIKRQDPIPFGPFLSLGAVFTLFHRLPFGFPLSF